MIDALYVFERFIVPQIEGLLVPSSVKRETKRKKGEFEYIPLDMDVFVSQIRKVCELQDKAGLSYHEHTFVDVGCGIGTKLLVASELAGWTPVGIESSLEYLRVARRLIPDGIWIQKDALKIDYSPYDVIYFYCPCYDEEKQRELETRIIEMAKPGAYILANLKMSDEKVWRTPPMKHIWDRVVYQKQKTKKRFRK